MSASTSINTDFYFPPLPGTLSRILEIISADESVVSSEKLVDVIESDPVVTAYVLRRVNSVYYGVRRHIDRLDQAINLLGSQTVCEVVLAAGLQQAFPYLEHKGAQDVYTYIMRLSLASATISKALSRHFRFRLQSTAYTVGLLHQIGRFVFLRHKPDMYIPLWRQSSVEDTNHDSRVFHPPSIQEEEALFNLSHVQMGKFTADRWQLPETLSTPIAHYPSPGEISKPHLRILTMFVWASHEAAMNYLVDRNSSRKSTSPRQEALGEQASARNTKTTELLVLIEALYTDLDVLLEDVLSL